MAARPASRPCLAGGSRARRPPARSSHADPRRGLRTGEEEEEDEEGMVVAQQRGRLHPRAPQGERGGKGELAPSPPPAPSHLLAVTWGCCVKFTAKLLLKYLRLKDTGSSQPCSSQPCSPWFWEPGPAGAGAALPHTAGAGRAGRGHAGVKQPSPAACSQRKHEVPESSTPICQGASQAFKCKECPGSGCARQGGHHPRAAPPARPARGARGGHGPGPARWSRAGGTVLCRAHGAGGTMLCQAGGTMPCRAHGEGGV